MNDRHFHTPVSPRPSCPVCKKAVYSRGGIHPQCAMARSEPPRPKKPRPQEADGAAATDTTVVGTPEGLGVGDVLDGVTTPVIEVLGTAGP